MARHTSRAAAASTSQATERFQSWAIPSAVGIIRKGWVTRDGELLIHQSSSKRIGRDRIPPVVKDP